MSRQFVIVTNSTWHRDYKTFFLLKSFIMLINDEMPKVVSILTFMSIINTTSESLKAKQSLVFYFLWAVEISCSFELTARKIYNLGA